MPDTCKGTDHVVIALGAFVWRKSGLPSLGQAPSIEFPSTGVAQAEEFLDGNFSVITDGRNLPNPVLAAFTERGGSRLVIANPGKKKYRAKYLGGHQLNITHHLSLDNE